METFDIQVRQKLYFIWNESQLDISGYKIF